MGLRQMRPIPGQKGLRTSIAAIICTLALAGAVRPGSAQAVRAEILEFGIFETQVVGLTKAPKTVSGVINKTGYTRLVRETQVVAAMPGRTFGVKFRIAGPAAADDYLTYRNIHPPLTNPKTGRTLKIGEWRSRIGLVREKFIGFGFDHGWEMAEGLWTLQIYYRGQLIGEKTFKVVVPLN